MTKDERFIRLRKALDEFLPLARANYQEQKIKYNLFPTQEGWNYLEKLRKALENVEQISEKWQ